MDIAVPITLFVKMVCTLVVWLHIRAGVSRSVANTTLKALQLIFSSTLYLVEVALCSSGINVKLSKIQLPHDVRTAYRLHFTKPEITRTACCPSCFSLYPSPNIPWKCVWKSSKLSKPCNTQLWKTQNTSKGLKWIPRSLYTTQSFDSWLQFFLSRQIIVDSLEESFQRRTNHPPPAFGADMTDVQDSPAWRDLHGFFQSPLHLVFSLYIDWFNPLTNKIAGILLYYFNQLIDS